MRFTDDIYLVRALSLNRVVAAMETETVGMDGDPIIRGFGGNRLAIVRASGVVVRENGDEWDDYLDATALAETLEEMDEDDSIDGILVVMDSPGGMCNGTPEAAQRIAAIGKPLVMWTPSLMCSAAYWLAASADAIIASQSSIVGNVGAYIMHRDFSKVMESMGIQSKVFSSGALKAVGAMGVALTPEQEAHIQARVDRIAGQFFDWVSTYRDNVSMDVFDGRDVLGIDAVEMGLIDDVVDTESEAVEFLANML